MFLKSVSKEYYCSGISPHNEFSEVASGKKERPYVARDYYTYDATSDRSACLVVDDKDKLELVLLIPSEADVHIWVKTTGKNTSDQAHLKRGHQDVHESTKTSVKTS